MTNTNVWMKQVFSSAQYAYVKDDLASKQRPSVFCYPLWDEKISFSYSEMGKICLELHFNLKEQRVDLAQNVIQIANLIKNINAQGLFTQHCQKTMAGLFWVGKFCHSDYSKVYAKESVVKIILDYNVDLLAYQTELQAQGYDITSPDEQIYVAVTNLLETVQILDKNLEPIINT